MRKEKKKETKDVCLTVRVKKYERNYIRKMAEKKGVSISDYIRKKCLESGMDSVDRKHLLCWAEVICCEMYNHIEKIYGRNNEVEEWMEEQLEEIWNSLL